ncbi:uncharacterized protein [Typha angustifolia]|uniref:uncharacterized protein n=1 Tax=Typha angustifolia TaxID=59011 RepID=UPI003C30DC9E
MAESDAATTEISAKSEPEAASAEQAVEEVTPPEEAAVGEGTEALGGGELEEVPVETPEADRVQDAVLDHKRKLEDLENAGNGGAAPVEKTEEGDEEVKPEGDVKRQRVDGEIDGLDVDKSHEVQNLEAPPVENGQREAIESMQPTSEGDLPKSTAEDAQEGSVSTAGQSDSYGLASTASSRKIEVPNNKVGVLIGKAGDTIKFLQINSGAKIQITRDGEADPNSSTRPVELIGSLESINKAEQLIRDVIAEADAGGSPALVARGFGTVQSGAEQTEIQVPNEKVGLVIGKGGETIKNLQTRSGARIQLIPQHLPEGEVPKERTVRVTGNKKQIDAAKEMIKEVISQVPSRSVTHSGGYGQQAFRPRGPSMAPQWGARPQPPLQTNMGYDYQQRGMYPPKNMPHPSQPYGNYPQQPSRSGMSGSWDHRPGAPLQTHQHPGGYDYYKQGGQSFDTQSSNIAPAPAAAPVNYNYGQSQGPGYGQPNPYPQSAPTQQGYGHGYDEPKYDSQVPNQQYYGQQPVSSQPGLQSGYPQQQDPYGKPAYGGGQQSYGPPRAAQPGDAMYQGSAPSSYGSGVPGQQSYPYGSSAPSQPAPAYGQNYGPTPGSVDGYGQPAAAGYSQHGGQVAPGYAQGAPAGPAYAQQSTQSGGYAQYPSQPAYGDQTAPNNVNYGYQGGPADQGYGNTAPASGYGSAPAAPTQAGYGQAGYTQPPSNPTGYEQPTQQQAGYGSLPGSAPVAYAKGVSPQPGYGGQWQV